MRTLKNTHTKINIFVVAKTHAHKAHIKKIDETHFQISVPELAQENKANRAIQKLLAKFLEIPQSSLLLVKGAISKYKTFIRLV